MKKQIIPEIHKVITEDNWELIHLRKKPQRKSIPEPLVLIHGLGQNHVTWDLEGRSFADFFVKSGMDVWILDLRGHGYSKKRNMKYDWSYDTYIEYDIPASIKYILKTTGEKKIFLAGHSLGGTMCYHYAALNRGDLQGIIPIGGPVKYGEGVPVMRLLAKANFLPNKFRLKSFVEYLPYFRLIDLGTVARVAFPLLNRRIDYFVPLHPFYCENVIENELKERIVLGFEKVSKGVIKQFIGWCSDGSLKSYNGKEDYFDTIKSVKVPALVIAGNKDRLAPPRSVKPAFKQISSKDKTFIVFSKENSHVHWGHLDLTMGKYGPTDLWPYILNWVRNHSKNRKG